MFDPKNLFPSDLLNYKRIGVAFSGGVDSHVLLYSLAKTLNKQKNLYALHINHSIDSKSDLWEKHCNEVCKELKINFVSFKLNLKDKASFNEDDLRKARYSKLFSWAKDGDVLFTAHHKDDNAETILFRILRGTAINGLKGIPYKRKVKEVDLIRPLLNCSKEEILSYAKKNNLVWIEDPSNKDKKFSRNFLRNEVFPLLKSKWPHYSDAFEKLAHHASLTQESIDEIADRDINEILLTDPNQLSVSKLVKLSNARRRNLIYRWLSIFCPKTVSTKLVDEVIKTFLISKYKTEATVSIGRKGRGGSTQIRRYEDKLFLLPTFSDLSNQQDISLEWDMKNSLELSTGKLSAVKTIGKGIQTDSTNNKVKIQFRSGGERCRPAGRMKSQTLKKLFQEYSIPPWLRDRLPLIYVEGEIAAVANIWTCEDFLASKEQYGMIFDWKDNLNNINLLKERTNGF